MVVSYAMKPKAGCDYLATAAHFAAEPPDLDAVVHYIDPDNEEMRIAYPYETDCRGMLRSFLTGKNQGILGYVATCF